MIKKFLKLSLILLVVLPLLLVLLVKNPNYIGFFVEKFSHHILKISNIDVELTNNILTLSSERVILDNDIATSEIQNASIRIDFSEPYKPHNSIIVERLDIAVKLVHTQNNTTTTQKREQEQTTHQANFKYLPLRFVDIKNLRVTYKDFIANGDLQIKDSTKGWLVTGFVERADVATTLKYLYLLPYKSVVNYLNSALKTGYASNIHYTILSGNTTAIDITGKIHNGYINFYKGWDYIDNINADFVIDNTHMLIDFDYAKINKLETSGKVKINWENELFIDVSAKTTSDSKIAVDFLKQSPLSKDITTSLKQFKINGTVDATLNLHIPITAKNQKTQAIVNAQLTNNNFSTLEDKLIVNNIDATLVFDEYLFINGTGEVFNALSKIGVVIKNDLEITVSNTYGEAHIDNANNRWNAYIQNDNIMGDISLDLSKEIPKLHLQDFFIIRDKNSSNTSTNNRNNHDINIAATEVPSFDLTTKNITINNKKFPDISSSLIHDTDGLHIKNLEFEGIKLRGENIQFNGMWVDRITSFHTTLSGKQLNDLFESFDIAEETAGGKFSLDIRGACLCKPWEINTTNISGYAQATIEKGSFTTQDNNIGKILSFLNITSLAKRLSLNEEEFDNSGFNYDSINTEAILNTGGIATIENFKLLSDSSTIDLTGNSNIDLQSYNLNALVVPEIKDSIPIATILAGGGLSGLGVWLLDKVLFKEELLNSTLGSVTNFEYKITGDWENPQIDKL